MYCCCGVSRLEKAVGVTGFLILPVEFGVFLSTGVNGEVTRPTQKLVKLVRDIKLGFSSFWTILPNYNRIFGYNSLS